MNLNPNREVLNAETPFYGICYFKVDFKVDIK